ncbi:unnamed protein product [Prunus armeniaca]|uniref:Uncharacterized protein n=1 Tax=Prunus armeniaca TaxID=36596 RepID=A0A6J5XRM2_PRUAR|nr:unnamed protein product [Prunus armeniaca]
MRSRHVFLTHNSELQVQPACKQFEFQCHVYGPDAIPTHSDCAGHPPPHHLISFFFPRTSKSKSLTLLDLATISVRTISGVFSGHFDAGKFIDLLSADRPVINRFYFSEVQKGVILSSCVFIIGMPMCIVGGKRFVSRSVNSSLTGSLERKCSSLSGEEFEVKQQKWIWMN